MLLFEIILLKMNLSFEHYLCLWILNMFGHKYVNVYRLENVMPSIQFLSEKYFFICRGLSTSKDNSSF